MTNARDELLDRADEYLSTIVNKGNCGPHHLVSDLASELRAHPPAQQPEGEAVAWLDIRTAGLSWENRIIATNYQFVKNNGPENFVVLATPPRPPEAGREIKFGYTNWRNENSLRRARPISIRYGHSEYHKNDTWLMLAFDLDKNENREFEMRSMLLVEPNAAIALATKPAQDDVEEKR